MENTESKAWFITGVSTGFGRELMTAALERGDSVFGTVRNPELVEELEKMAPGRAFASVMDVTDEASVRQTVISAAAKLKKLDVVVNNAGFGLLGAIEETSAEEVEHQFATNVFGALNIIRAAMPILREQASGHVLNITSIGGLVAYPGWGVYNGTKFALEGISEALRKEVAPFGVKVSAIEPSAFRTDWAGRSLRAASQPIAAYEEGSPRQYVGALNGQQKGDPARAAQAMLKLVDMNDPPAQLLLGSEAMEDASNKFENALSEFDEFAELSRSADFPD